MPENYHMMLSNEEKNSMMQAIGALPGMKSDIADIKEDIREIFPRIKDLEASHANLKGAHDVIQSMKPKPSESRQDLPAVKPTGSWWDKCWPGVVQTLISTGVIGITLWFLYLFSVHGKG